MIESKSRGNMKINTSINLKELTQKEINAVSGGSDSSTDDSKKVTTENQPFTPHSVR